MKIPQKLVGIAGRSSSVLFKNCFPCTVALQENPLVRLQNVEQTGRDLTLTFDFLSHGRTELHLTVGDRSVCLPAVGFREKEYFMCLVISSNYHIGMDPEAYIIGPQPDGSVPEGHGFEKVCRKLIDPYVRPHRLPVTWLIDEAVAICGKQRLTRWHTQYGDDYGIMPPSFIHYNAVNYNRTKTAEALTAYLKEEKDKVERQFETYTDLVGIDQFIGSVDDPFVKACEALDIRGLWGIGFDHFSCDTSMYHRGAPWDCYKPDCDNMRRPAPYGSRLWALQWTQRDLLNTFKTPTGNSGSVIFSSDVDDIRTAHIMEHQADYYNKMLAEYYNSVMELPQNEFGLFLMHQEDHDTGFDDNNAYWGHFLDTLDTPVTFATLPEVTAWLNLKYGERQHPTQVIVMRDVLTCKGEMQFIHGDVKKPEDWGPYPPHVFYYDRNYQLVLRQGNPIPVRLMDYKSNWPNQNNNYPEWEVNARLLSQAIEGDYYTAQLQVNEEYVRMPLLAEILTEREPFSV